MRFISDRESNRVVIGLLTGLIVFIIAQFGLPSANGQTENIDALLKIIQQQPSANAFYELGLLYLNEDAYEKARDQFIRCIRHEPRGPFALRARTKIGLIYYRLQQYETAEQELQKVRLTQPNFSEADQILNRIRLIQEAQAAFSQNLLEVARVNFQQVLAEDSSNQFAQEQLKRIEIRQNTGKYLERTQYALDAGQLDTAENWLNAATSLWNEHPQIAPLRQRLASLRANSFSKQDSLKPEMPAAATETVAERPETAIEDQIQDSMRYPDIATDTIKISKPIETSSETSENRPVPFIWLFFGIFFILLLGIVWLFRWRRQKSGQVRRQKIAPLQIEEPETPPLTLPIVQSGVKIGKYEIIEVLKQGGMGLVVKARHPHFRKPVVIKSILPELKQQVSVRERFLREANLLFELDHPNIVRVTDLFEADQQVYLVMQFVDGANLKEIIERDGWIPEMPAVSLMLQACAALSYLHAHHIIHRDIKPENMMLEHKTGILKLVDFGIVKPQNAGFDESLTSASRIAGTPKYMSPEQLLNDVIDTRSDIFALGISFYEILTGQHPFECADISIIRAILEKKTPPLRREGQSLPADLAEICEKMLAKDRQRRYQTTDEIVKDLNRFLERTRSG